MELEPVDEPFWERLFEKEKFEEQDVLEAAKRVRVERWPQDCFAKKKVLVRMSTQFTSEELMKILGKHGRHVQG